MIVFDLSRPNTLDSVKKWKTDIDSKVRLPDPNESPIPVILLANKVYFFFFSHLLLKYLFFFFVFFIYYQSDLVKNALNPTQLDQYCKENGIVKWFETSAKDNVNVEEAANFLVRQILDTESQSRVDSETDSQTVDVTTEQTNEKQGGGCPC